MQDESSGTLGAREDDPMLGGGGEQDHGDWSVLSLLLAHEGHEGLWSIDELGRMLQDQIHAVDAVGRLLRDGLIHRQGDFVFPTRAATRFNQIVE
ncbi:MAG TPA: hypothetical protein VID48_01090 [Solirubrobacteraceae bacterium]|jgi:hypothetical protein